MPETGGLFDQPLRLITEMELAQYTAESFQERARAAKRGKLVEWAGDNPDTLKYCMEVDELLNG